MAFINTLVVLLSGCSNPADKTLNGVYIAELISEAEIATYVKDKSLSSEDERVKLHRSKLRSGLPSGQLGIQQTSDKFVLGNDKSIRYIDNVMNFGGSYEIADSNVKLTIYRYNKAPGEDDVSQLLKLDKHGVLRSEEEYLDWLVFKKWSPHLDYTKPTLAEQITLDTANTATLEEGYIQIKAAIKNKSFDDKPLTESDILLGKYQLEGEAIPK